MYISNTYKRETQAAKTILANQQLRYPNVAAHSRLSRGFSLKTIGTGWEATTQLAFGDYGNEFGLGLGLG